MSTVEIQVRNAKPRDASALADIHAAAWREAYLGIIPSIEVERMVSRRGAVWWLDAVRRGRHIAVLDFGGNVAGYATFGRGRVAGLAQGEVYELYIQPEYQGVGLGRRLFGAARERLARRRLKGVIVWSLADNERACAFYRALGGVAKAKAVERLGEAQLDKTAFVWP